MWADGLMMKSLQNSSEQRSESHQKAVTAATQKLHDNVEQKDTEDHKCEKSAVAGVHRLSVCFPQSY